jgi:hypothetical protein
VTCYHVKVPFACFNDEVVWGAVSLMMFLMRAEVIYDGVFVTSESAWKAQDLGDRLSECGVRSTHKPPLTKYLKAEPRAREYSAS